MKGSRSTCSPFLRGLLFDCTTNLSEKFLNQNLNNFHIEIVHDTIKSLNCVMGQNISFFLLVVMLIDLHFCGYWIWVFPKMHISIFTSQKISQILWESVFRPLIQRWKEKKIQYTSNILYLYTLMYIYSLKIFISKKILSKITMEKGIGCVYKHIQNSFPHPSPNLTFLYHHILWIQLQILPQVASVIPHMI